MRLFSDCSNRRHSCGSFLLVSFVCGWFVPTALLVTSEVSATNVLPNPPTDHLSSRAPVRRGYLIRVGQSINLTCPYDVPFYSWTHSAQPNKILSDKQLLFIKSATLENSGRYVCQAIDGYGTNSADFAVRVIDPPTDHLSSRAPVRRGYLIRVGQSINLTCPYDVPFYSWTHSAQPNKILSDKQLLFIKSATLENSGRYVCQAIDGYGTNSADFAVRVIGEYHSIIRK
ncbi:hypothetical protein AHF37_05699 [Paragonimus kellicotti]|nr:hypothetical protein AHF37_05699 [Paragonimus kellicotti]